MYSIIVAILFAIEIASVLTFLTGASAKLKRAHVKRYTQCICAKRLGGLAVKSFPGSRDHLVRPCWGPTKNLGGMVHPGEFKDQQFNCLNASIKRVTAFDSLLRSHTLVCTAVSSFVSKHCSNPRWDVCRYQKHLACSQKMFCNLKPVGRCCCCGV